MTTTPADPGAIDRILDAARQGVYNSDDIPDLIAAVEALREREAEALTMIANMLDGEMKLSRRAEAAEARGAEVAGALRSLYVETGKLDKGTPAFRDAWLQARAVLAATPAEALERASDKDQAYLERNHLVAALARLYPSGTKRTNIPDWSSDWHGCVYIDLPTGQISYHYHDSHAYLFEDLPSYESGWDGHDKEMVHHRLANLRALHKRAEAEGYTAGLEAAAEIAEAIDSGRGNEKEIAKAIRALTRQEGP